MRARVLVSLAALAFAGLVHCSSGNRAAFDMEPQEPAGASDEDPSGEPGGGTFGQNGPVEAGTSTCTEDIDVVLVLDVSSTMRFVLDRLEREIQRVVTATNALKSGAHFGLVVFADNAALSDNGDEANGKVHTTATTLKKAFASARSTYTGPNRNPGDGPSGPTTQNPICEENALDALHMAATDFPWRDKAAHVVIVATDDTFLEAPDNYGDRDGDGATDKTDFPREGDYPARYTLDETIATLKAADVRVFSFSRHEPPRSGGCSTGRRHVTASGDDDRASVAYGWSQPYHGKPPVPEQTGGKDFDLEAVRSGKVSLADTINEIVLESHCAGGPK